MKINVPKISGILVAMSHTDVFPIFIIFWFKVVIQKIMPREAAFGCWQLAFGWWLVVRNSDPVAGDLRVSLQFP